MKQLILIIIFLIIVTVISFTSKPLTKQIGGTNSCIKTGCSGNICADKPIISTCEWRPSYNCFGQAKCEIQPNGQCGFTPTSQLENCLAQKQN